MRMKSGIFAAVMAIACTHASAAADICKYIDEDGRTVYSTAALKHGKKLVCFKSAAPPPPAATDEESVSRSERAVESAPQAKVDSATQTRRDNDRREILKSELHRERRLLDDAQKRFEEEEATRSGDERNYQRVLDRLKPYQDKVNLHKRNVDSIQQEIANLR